MANVYWFRSRATDLTSNVIAKVNALLALPEVSRLVGENASIAIKFNLSELGYQFYLPPVIFTSLFERLRNLGAKPVLTDSCSTFKGSRFDGYSWVDTALLLGFSAGESFDNQLLQAGGYTNEEGNFWSIDGQLLAGINIGSLLTNVDNVIVVTHVTAHPLAALNGALYNLGIGFLTSSGKLKIHSFLRFRYKEEACDQCGLCVPFCPTGALSGEKGNVRFDERICNKCLGCIVVCPRGAMSIDESSIPAFQECVIDAALGVKNHIRGGVFFISFLSMITPQPDDYPYSDIPFLPDLGFLASEDPVALDWVTYQMITQSPGVPGSIAEEKRVLKKGDNKLKAITNNTPEQMIEYAEKIGLGTRKLNLLREGQREIE